MEKVFVVSEPIDEILMIYRSREDAQKMADKLNAGYDREYATIEEMEVL